jgi:hypothetical protein
MRTSFTQMYVHCVWATWNREPLITAEVQGMIYGAIVHQCEVLKCTVIAIPGPEVFANDRLRTLKYGWFRTTGSHRMTVREALLSEIDRSPDEVLNVLLSILRITHGQSQNQGLETVVTMPNHYPLRGLPLEMSDDFDAPMTM